MEVPPAKCAERKCRHWRGWKSFPLDPQKNDGIDYEIRNICDAFPKGIPDEIAFGNNKHLKPLPGQKNSIVYDRI